MSLAVLDLKIGLVEGSPSVPGVGEKLVFKTLGHGRVPRPEARRELAHRVWRLALCETHVQIWSCHRGGN